MDDIARDVVQRQAHNEYVVASGTTRARPRARPRATPRLPWHELDGGVQEMILQEFPKCFRTLVVKIEKTNSNVVIA